MRQNMLYDSISCSHFYIPLLLVARVRALDCTCNVRVPELATKVSCNIARAVLELFASFRLDSGLGCRRENPGNCVWKMFLIQTLHRILLRSTVKTFTLCRIKVQQDQTAYAYRNLTQRSENVVMESGLLGDMTRI
jgi:hypothetical protein